MAKKKSEGPAGYVIVDHEAVWGHGATEQEAWGEWEIWIEPGDPEQGIPDPERSEFRCMPATADLIAEVEEKGGDIFWWELRDGTCCTEAEGRAAEGEGARPV